MAITKLSFIELNYSLIHVFILFIYGIEVNLILRFHSFDNAMRFAQFNESKKSFELKLMAFRKSMKETCMF